MEGASPDSQAKALSRRWPCNSARSGDVGRCGLHCAGGGARPALGPGRGVGEEVVFGPRRDSGRAGGGGARSRLSRRGEPRWGSREEGASPPRLARGGSGYLRRVGGADLPVCAGPQPPRPRSREAREGAREAETPAGLRQETLHGAAGAALRTVGAAAQRRRRRTRRAPGISATCDKLECFC